MVSLLLVLPVAAVHTEDEDRQHHQTQHHAEDDGQLVVVIRRGTAGRRHGARGQGGGRGRGSGVFGGMRCKYIGIFIVSHTGNSGNCLCH